MFFVQAFSHHTNVGTTHQTGCTIKDLVVDMGEGVSLCERRLKADDQKRKKKSYPLPPRPIQPAAARETRGIPGQGRGLTCAEANATKSTPDERQHPPHSVDAQRTERLSAHRYF